LGARIQKNDRKRELGADWWPPDRRRAREEEETRVKKGPAQDSLYSIRKIQQAIRKKGKKHPHRCPPFSGISTHRKTAFELRKEKKGSREGEDQEKIRKGNPEKKRI